MEKKIFLEKNDGLEVAVEGLINAKSDTVILNIPKDSVLGRSVNNFHVLKREANTAEKVVMIESIDDHILELASLATITAINPVFQKKERAVSDILPRSAVLLKKQALSKIKKHTEEEAEEANEERSVADIQGPRTVFYEENNKSHSGEQKREKKRQSRGKKKILLFLISFVSLGVLLFVYLGWFVLPHATVVMTLKKKTVPFHSIIEVSQNYTEPKATDSKILLKGQFIVSQGNFSSPISGATAISEEASYAGGLITVVNEFGTTQQKLVATTRFETPDGKIFRLRKDLVVPGGKMIKGVLKPGSVAAEVIADKPGEEYNIGPIERFTIPGFKDTPRFTKFYGVSSSTMTGGSDGIKLSASTSTTEGETEESVIEKLKVSLEGKLSILDSAQLAVLNDAKQFLVTKKDIQVSSSSAPTLYVEGTLKEIGFNEGELKTVLGDFFKREAGDAMKIKSVSITYGTSTPNFATGVLSAPIDGEVIFEQDVDANSLRTSILGKSANEVTAFILSVPGVESASVSVKPLWVTKIPTNSVKVDFRTE